MSIVADHATTVISEDQRHRYATDGYLLLEEFVAGDWLNRLRAASASWVDKSRELTESDAKFDLEDGHNAADPRLRRLMSPVDLDPTFQEFALAGPAAQLALDLLGAPARFHHSKLNFKWSGGGAEVKWHQDIQFWPHTDFTPLTIGVYLDDVDDEMGPMGIVPGSHTGPLFPLNDESGNWTGSLRDTDVGPAGVPRADYLKGPAGSVTVHNCCCVHGSVPNNSTRPRPLLLQTYSAGDSFPLLGIGTNGRVGNVSGTLIGGSAPAEITVAGRAVPTAPDWSKGGYTTIFDSQEDELDQGPST